MRAANIVRICLIEGPFCMEKPNKKAATQSPSNGVHAGGRAIGESHPAECRRPSILTRCASRLYMLYCHCSSSHAFTCSGGVTKAPQVFYDSESRTMNTTAHSAGT